MDLYSNIKFYRKQLNITQDELAKLTGYTDRTSIAKIEAGQVDLSQSKILAFAKALQTTPVELMGWTDTPAYTSQEQHLVNNFNQLNTLGKDRLIETSDDMVSNKKYTEASVSKKNA